MEDRPNDQEALASSAAPFIVGLDGTYVHAKDQRSRTERWFEVIVGKSLPAKDRSSECFGFVSRYDPEHKRRRSAWLEGLGLQRDQPVTFLSDGGDTVRELPKGLIPQAEYVLDRFHVTIRLTGMSRVAQGVQAEDYPKLGADLEEMLEHLKWNLWHGEVDRALESVDELAYALEVEDASPEHRKVLKAVRAFEAYVTNHRAVIPNYGERYRQDKTISTAFVESAVNQVGEQALREKATDALDAGRAHLLQIRIQVLNQTWRGTLSRWYPDMQATPRLKAA